MACAFGAETIAVGVSKHINMRLLPTITLLFISNFLLGQTFMMDRGSMDEEKLNTGRSAIAWIEMNKPDRILEYLSKDNKIDIDSFKTNCKLTSDEFPFDNSLPGFLASDEKDAIWYERTYYQKSGEEIQYLLQIYIDLVWEDERSKIVNIEFRRNKQIEPRDTEFNLLNRIGEIPPPPPPPPALPVKH